MINMSWKRILKFETTETLLERYEDLENKIRQGHNQYGGHWESFAGRLLDIKRVLEGENYEEDIIFFISRQITKMEDYMDDWPYDDIFDIRLALSNFYQAFKRKVDFIKEQE